MITAILIIIIVCIAFFFFYKFIFLRDNKNKIPSGHNIVSPASGRIVSIQEINNQSSLQIRKGFFGKIETFLDAGESYFLINIFMNPWDVHIQKMPIDGTILNIEQTPGKFRPVMTLDAGLENEKQEFLIQTEIGKIKVIQIAGFLARRNRSFVQIKQALKKGEHLGIILLGSQTALIFPKKNITLQVKVGDVVSSGETILCNL